MRLSGPLAIALIWLFAPMGANGQNSLAAFHDSLSSLTTEQLHAVLQAGKAAMSADQHLRSGFAALRLFELETDPADAEAARNFFQQGLADGDVTLKSWAHYGLGALLARGAERSREPRSDRIVTLDAFAAIFGKDPQSRARDEFRAALAADAGLVPALVALAELAQDKRRAAELHEARNALVKATERSADARVWLALASIESALGMNAAAQNAAEQVLRADSSNASARYALARALFLQPGHHRVALHHYFAGLSLSDQPAAELYLRDASYILSSDELRNVRWLRSAERAQRLRTMWEGRAAHSGVTVAERLAEHYTRIAHAEKEYRRETQYGAPPVGSLVVEGLADLPFDDRGVLLVRHGKPLDVISTIANGLPPNQTWVYGRPDTAGYRLFNFLKYPGTPDYRLIARLPPCDSTRHADLDPSVRSGLVTPYDARWVEGVIKYYEDRGRYDARFHQLAAHCHAATIGRAVGRSLMDTTTVRNDALELSMEHQREALQALETDTHHPNFSTAIPFVHRLYAFRGRDTLSDLTAAVLIPGNRVSASQTAAGQTVYPVAVSLILIDSTTTRVVRVDTTLYFESTRALTRDDFLRLHVNLRAPLRHSWTYRLVVHDPTAPDRGGVMSGRLAARAPGGDSLELSDLVVAESDRGRWHRGTVDLALLPPHEIEADRAFVLFYEIYNLPVGSTYSSEITFEPVRSGALSALRRLIGGSGRLQVRFNGTTRSEPAQITHRIISQLPPGEYRLRISVTDPRAGRQEMRETRLELLPASVRHSRTDARKQ